MSKLTELAEKESYLIGKLKRELDFCRNLLARLNKSNQMIIPIFEYRVPDTVQFSIKSLDEKDAIIDMVDLAGIHPLVSDYQRILELMEILEL